MNTTVPVLVTSPYICIPPFFPLILTYAVIDGNIPQGTGRPLADVVPLPPTLTLFTCVPSYTVIGHPGAIAPPLCTYTTVSFLVKAC